MEFTFYEIPERRTDKILDQNESRWNNVLLTWIDSLFTLILSMWLILSALQVVHEKWAQRSPKKTYFRQSSVLFTLKKCLTHELSPMWLHHCVEMWKGYRMVCNRTWTATSSVQEKLCNAIDVLIFVARLTFFIKRRFTRETLCDTSMYHSIEEKKNFKLRCGFKVNTWIIISIQIMLRIVYVHDQ